MSSRQHFAGGRNPKLQGAPGAGRTALGLPRVVDAQTVPAASSTGEGPSPRPPASHPGFPSRVETVGAAQGAAEDSGPHPDYL